jgi:hypothetical protein
MKNLFSKSNFLIIAPLAIVMVLDGVFTMAGQSEAYWQNYALFNEGSPLGQSLMLNPAYFISFFVAYVVLVSILVVSLKRPLNVIVWLGFFLGHAWGGSTWAPRIFFDLTGIAANIDRWYLVVGYFILIAVIAGLFINKWLKLKGV